MVAGEMPENVRGGDSPAVCPLAETLCGYQAKHASVELGVQGSQIVDDPGSYVHLSIVENPAGGDGNGSAVAGMSSSDYRECYGKNWICTVAVQEAK